MSAVVGVVVVMLLELELELLLLLEAVGERLEASEQTLAAFASETSARRPHSNATAIVNLRHRLLVAIHHRNPLQVSERHARQTFHIDVVVVGVFCCCCRWFAGGRALLVWRGRVDGATLH